MAAARGAQSGGGAREFALPDLGEGLTEGEILQWFVAPGDIVALNQPLVEVETAKAAVEIPSPYAGTVEELLAEAGATVDVGAPIVRFDTGAAPGSSVDGDPHAQAAAQAQAAGAAANPAESATRAVDQALAGPPAGDDLVPPAATREPVGAGREAVLVGYGVRPGTAQRRPRRSAAAPPLSLQRTPAMPQPPAPAGSPSVLAKPPVRKLAKDLGVDLAGVTGTGEGGIVTRTDVQTAAERSPERERGAAPAGRERSERRTPIAGVRKATARAVVASAFTAPHVTLFQTVDVTESSALVRRLREQQELEGLSVSPLLLVARALMLACHRHPDINASWDEDAQEIVVHGQVNLGIAAATPRGLLVPNIKDADTLGLAELARALTDVARTAREGRTTPADMAGGTITITNVGSFGVDNGTPILNPGEAAILCLGAVRPQPWVHEGVIAVRDVTTLTLSVDHRLIDGQLGSLVLADVASVLRDPTLLHVWS